MGKYTTINGMRIRDGVLVKYLRNDMYVKIPDGVVSIKSRAFCSKDLSVLVVPDSVKVIDKYAFSDCYMLHNITIPKHVEIKDGAFRGCKSLRDRNGMVIVNNILFDCFDHNIREVEIRDVDVVAGCAFSSCHFIEKIKVHEGVKEISSCAFGDCRKVTEIELPTSLQPLSSSCFTRCDNLQVIRCEDINIVPPNHRLKAINSLIADNVPKDTDRWKNHMRYLRKNCLKYKDKILSDFNFLEFMCTNKLIKASDYEILFEIANEKQDIELISRLLEYNFEKITEVERERASQKDDKIRAKILAKKIAKRSNKGVEGLTFVFAIKKQNTKRIRADLTKAGGVIRNEVTGNTDFVIKDRYNDKKKLEKAESLGIDIISSFDLEIRLYGYWRIEDGVLERYYGDKTKIRIPDDVRHVDSYAFVDNHGITQITLGYGFASFSPIVFRHLPLLRDLIFEYGDSMWDIEDIPKTVVIHAPEGSRVHRLAEEAGHTFVPLDE